MLLSSTSCKIASKASLIALLLFICKMVCLFRLMSQRYGNQFFLRNFFRNYLQGFLVFPVFTGVLGHKKRGAEAPLSNEINLTKLGAQLRSCCQRLRLSQIEIKETVYVQSNLCTQFRVAASSGAPRRRSCFTLL